MQITFAGTVIASDPTMGGTDGIDGFMLPKGQPEVQWQEALRANDADPFIYGVASNTALEGNSLVAGAGITLTPSGTTVTISSYATYTHETSSFTAVAGKVYGMDTTSGSITCTPPASPSDGDWFKVFDVAKKWGTNQAVIGSSSQNYIDHANPTATAGPYDLNAVPYSGQGVITFVWDATLSVWSVN